MAVWGADGPLALRAPGEPGSVCYAAPEHGTHMHLRHAPYDREGRLSASPLPLHGSLRARNACAFPRHSFQGGRGLIKARANAPSAQLTRGHSGLAPANPSAAHLLVGTTAQQAHSSETRELSCAIGKARPDPRASFP